MYPYPIFTIFGQPVYLYGLFIGLGIIACFFVYFLYTKAGGIDKEVREFGFYVAIIAIALGFGAAYLYQAIYNWIADGVFAFSGITAMGGFIGGALAYILAYFLIGKFYFSGKRKGVHIKNFNVILRVAPICVTIAHAFGRIGCLMAGCCHGTFLGLEPVAGGLYMRAVDTGISGYYIPTQLYEALFLFLLFGVLSLLYFKRFNITPHVYLIAYGIWRFVIEFWRTDARAKTGALAPSQWQSFVFVGAGIALLIIYLVKKWPIILPEPEKAVEEEKTDIDSLIKEEIVDKTEIKEEKDTENVDSDNKKEKIQEKKKKDSLVVKSREKRK